MQKKQNKMKKISIFFIISIIFTSVSWGQNIKYKDIIETINKNKYQKAYSLLFEYQKKDPEFPNTYFQLGNISFFWATNSDPLTDLQQTQYYIKNTKLFYRLAINKLKKDDKDAKRNDNYYRTVNDFDNIKKLNNNIVIAYIDNKINEINKFDKNTHKTVKYFNKTIKHYNKSIKIFTNIINKHENVNDIYLQPKIKTISVTNDLIFSHDSTLFFYNLFKNSLISNPIKKYNQTLVQKNISTYRLQGLLSSNFLNDTIKIWDFKKWAKNIQNKMYNDISHLRQTIIETNKTLNDKLKKLKQDTTFSNSYKKFNINQKVFFEIEKYDYNSLISAFFRYQKAKINFLIQAKRSFNDTSNYSITSKNKANGYFKLTKSKNLVDSLLLKFNNKITKKNYFKHKKFIDFNFKNFDGLKNFVSCEKIDNYNIYFNSLNKFKYATYRDIFNLTSKPLTTSYKENKINLFVNTIHPDSAKINQYITTDIAKYAQKKYITGYYKTQNNSKAFVAKVINGNIEWLINTKTGYYNLEFGVKIKAFNKGCFVMIHSQQNHKHYNTLIQLNEKGHKLFSKKIKNPQYPRILDFDDINNNILIAFQGNNLNYYYDDSDNLMLQKINLNSKKTQWKKNIKLVGKLINVIKIDTSYHIYANYKLISYEGMNYFNKKGTIINLKINSESGNLADCNEILTDFFIWGLYAYKIDNKSISVLGLTKKTNHYKLKYKDLPPTYYVIFNPEGKIIFQNFKKTKN